MSGRNLTYEALLARLRALEQENAELLSLEVRSDNERAKALYRKFGFTTFGTFPKYFKIGGRCYDVDCMTLALAE